MTPTEHKRAWAARNPEKIKAIKQRWYAKNGPKIHEARRVYRAANREKLNEQKRKWVQENPDIVAMQCARKRIKEMNLALNRELRFHYDITAEQYNEILVAQNGVCAICHQFEVTGRVHRLVVDHCHETGRLRALLCHRCNCGIGYFKDNIERVKRAAAYLETFSANNRSGWAQRVKEALTNLEGMVNGDIGASGR